MLCDDSKKNDVVIEFDCVSKSYDRRAPSLRPALHRMFTKVKQRWFPAGPPEDSLFWAVRDLTFKVRQGETIGIIGENGAGKSTILKLMDGITSPTHGRVFTRGRIASLIELGAGFNPDLTGRENIILNGSVLGLSQAEIKRKFEHIVAFSGLERFLDIPVKYYSSGMYAKLGFAIAAHVEADIILTDEILAVGDAAFHRQCHKRFQELQASSTIILVSHDLQAIRKVCTRALWIRGGLIQLDSSPDEAVEAYLESVQQDREKELRDGRPCSAVEGVMRWGSGEIEIESVTTHDEQGREKSVFRTREDLVIRIHYQVKGPFRDPGFCIQLHTDQDVWVHGTNTFVDSIPCALDVDTGMVEMRYPHIPLLSGTYWIMAGVTSSNDWAIPYDVKMKAQRFEVLTASGEGGIIECDHIWTIPATGLTRSEPPVGSSLQRIHNKTRMS
jgi:ABC-type polysaccharide/polyol phosphate transport system ATPase subunit